MTQDNRFEAGIKELVLEYLKQEGIEVGDAEERVRKLLLGAGAKALGERWTQQASESAPGRLR